MIIAGIADAMSINGIITLMFMILSTVFACTMMIMIFAVIAKNNYI